MEQQLDDLEPACMECGAKQPDWPGDGLMAICDDCIEGTYEAIQEAGTQILPCEFCGRDVETSDYFESLEQSICNDCIEDLLEEQGGL